MGKEGSINWAKRVPEQAKQGPKQANRGPKRKKRGPANGQRRALQMVKRESWVSERRGPCKWDIRTKTVVLLWGPSLLICDAPLCRYYIIESPIKLVVTI